MSDRPSPAPVKSSDDDTKKPGANRGRGGFRRMQNVPTQQPKFEGRTEALKGFVYGYGDPKQADTYTQTKKKSV